MTYSTGQQQIPVLCAACTGPATPHPDGQVSCAYCGHVDRLPADEMGRALELERRLASARSSQAQLRGLEASLGHVFEDNWALVRVASYYAVPGILIGIFNPMGALVAIGIGLALAVALLLGRVSYRRRVRRFLFAHAPRQPGLPARCRVCDAGLPGDARGPFLVCEYCHTENLVTPEIHRDHARLLAEEYGFYRGRAGQIMSQAHRVSLHMRRNVILGLIVVFGGYMAIIYSLGYIVW